MRLGRVRVSIEYVVDLDNKEMVDHAKDCIVEDIDNAVKFNEEHTLLEIDTDGHGLEESDIPEFLLENQEQE